LALQPYKAKLGSKAYGLTRRMNEVFGKFSPPEDFINDKKLSGEFLLGYHSQLLKIQQDIASKKSKIPQEVEK
jgi:CRISPR-associated protein Csd1